MALYEFKLKPLVHFRAFIAMMLPLVCYLVLKTHLDCLLPSL